MPVLLKRFDVRVILIYLLAALVWLLVTQVLEVVVFTTNPVNGELFSAGKDFIFVVVTVFVLLFGLGREFRLRRQVEDRLRLERQISPTGIAILSPTGDVLSANAWAERTLGLPPLTNAQETVKRSIGPLTDFEGTPIPDDARPYARAVHTRQAVLGAQCAIEGTDGTRTLFKVNAVPLLEPDGSISEIIETFTDVTELETQTRAARLNESRWRALIENAPDGIFVQTKRNFAYVNPALVRMFGATSPEDLLGTPILDRLGPETESYVADRMHRVGVQRMPVPRGSHVFLRLDGTGFQAETSAVPIRYNGEDGALVFVRDATDRKRAEQDLFESEERYRLLLSSLKDFAVFSTDKNWDVTSWNSAAELMTGFTPVEVLHHTYPFWSSASHKAQLLDAMRTTGSFTSVGWRKRRDGSEFWAESHVTKMKDEDGRERGYSVVLRDLTSKRAAEEKIEYLAGLVDRVSEAIVSVDSEFVIRSWNKAAELLYGWNAEEAIGRRLGELVPTVYPNTSALAVMAVLNERGSWSGEAVQYRRDGTPIEISSSVTLTMDNEGKRDGAVGIYHDLTARKEIEREVLRSNKRLAVLGQIDREILNTRELTDMVEAVLRLIPQLIPCQRVQAILWETNDVAGIEYDLVCGREFRTRPHLLAGVEGERTPEPEETELTAGGLTAENSAWICAPILIQAKSVGQLRIQAAEPSMLDPEHVSVLNDVARQLAVAVQDARLFAEVRTKNQELHRLSLRMVEAQEAERRFIAHELHDEVGQMLTALSLTLERDDRGNPSSAGSEAQTIIKDLVKRVRNLSLDLRPSMLDDFGLIPTLQWYLERFERQTGIVVNFKHVGVEGRFDTALELTLYRIVQEALTNVARYAGVNATNVRVWRVDGAVYAQVEDSGVGFSRADTGLAHTGGILGMRERASMVGGTCDIESAVGAGTTVSVMLPLPEEQEDPT